MWTENELHQPSRRRHLPLLIWIPRRQFADATMFDTSVTKRDEQDTHESIARDAHVKRGLGIGSAERFKMSFGGSQVPGKLPRQPESV